MASKTVLVTRATGSQGKAAIAHLVKSGWSIRALVSDLSSDRAVALKSFGQQVCVIQATWKDPSSIVPVIRGCQALLLIQRPSFTDHDELQESHMILNLAKAAGVKHVAFSSSVVLNNPNALEDIGHLSAAPAVLDKAPVEDLVKALMRNSNGPNCILTLFDPDYIGAFAAATFNDPERLDGKAITILKEIVRFDDVVKAFSKAIGRKLEAIYLTEEETKKELANPLVSGNVLCIRLERLVDMDEVRAWDVPLTTFDELLDKHRHELTKVIPSEDISSDGAFSDIYTTSTK